ncbi:MAG: L,D-transpeptidase family protein [Firmicutes bacterium]|nr:L,D-transpeptidase family protein [Bacillota bacterium]
MSTHRRSSRRRQSGRAWWIAGLAVLGVAAVGLALFEALPRVKAEEAPNALADIDVQGWDAHVVDATWVQGAQVVPLTDRQGDLIPDRPLAAGERGEVRLEVEGPPLLAFLPADRIQRTLRATTPPAPALAATHLSHNRTTYLAVPFKTPVTLVRYTIDGRSREVRESVPSKVVRVPLPPSRPGSSGSLTVEAWSASWEPASGPRRITWASVPFITASASPGPEMAPDTPLRITFSAPIAEAHLNRWQVLPETPGHWKRLSATTFEFVPSSSWGFGPNALVAVKIPGGPEGPVSQNGSYLASATTLTWTTAPGSTLRLQELLAEEGYLPVIWKASVSQRIPDTWAAQERAIYQPPQGTFVWKYPRLPQELKSLWKPGALTVMIKGAIMQFERVNGLTVDGIAGPAVWHRLIEDHLRGITSPDGYTYIDVTENLPETLELWVNGKLVLKSLANTGIPATPTYLGTFPIYERLTFQIMRGHNPNGTPYADPVHWINYFEGGDAVHGFLRAAYGFPQSLGCVELPIPVAETVYHLVHYGTLVTVNPPGVAPAPANTQLPVEAPAS